MNKFDFKKLAIVLVFFVMALPHSMLSAKAQTTTTTSYEATATPEQFVPLPAFQATPSATPEAVVVEEAAPPVVVVTEQQPSVNVTTVFDAIKYSLKIFQGMIFFSTLAQLILSFLKQRQYITDEKAKPILVTLQIVLIAVMAGVHVVKPEFDLAILDTYFKAIADSWGTILPLLLLVSTWFAKYFYDEALRGVPFIGFSNTLQPILDAEAEHDPA